MYYFLIHLKNRKLSGDRMPTLQWIGKEKIINHHLDVSYRVLNHRYGFTEKGEQNTSTGSGNMIIHGDNLEALKSLLPKYEGKIKCIYIDPPYNTGNEGWVYNDNVNHPKIRKWLEKTLRAREDDKDASVGTDDLTRHDKWLCMMYPRLKLLEKLLAKDGVIFISIDETEATNLRIVCDEVFGTTHHIASFVWRRRASSMMSQNNVSVDHEYVIAYSKSQVVLNGIDKDYKNYSNTDNDPRGPWTLGDLTVGMTREQRPNQFYDLIDPETGITYSPSSKRVWTFAPESMNNKIAEKRVVFPKNKTGRPMLKRYLSELRSEKNPISSWLSSEAYSIGLNSEGTKIIQDLFDEKVFDYPKPISLLELLISQVGGKNAIILDSFAGSGTTAHAVLNLNKKDGGNRKFILIEMEDYANEITAERVKRVIKGHSDKEGKSDSFDFYELGESLFTEENTLNERLPVDKLREYIWFTETRSSTAFTNAVYLGKHNSTGYYFLYEKDQIATLNYSTLSAYIKEKAESYIIYADNCLLPESFMQANNIIFKKTPRDITRF
jgi:adenine-specific DNA-methyltransferase